MNYTTIFFDLDDTLYPPENGLWSAIRERMNEYMLVRLKMDPQVVPTLRREYFEKYGTTLRGLQMNYQVDAEEFLDYVHDLPVHQIVRPDPALRSLLLSLPQRRFIFTNADSKHAGRVLSSLGVQDCFEGIIDLRAMGFYCKPEPASYQTALAQAGASGPQACVYLDDLPRNLAPARQLGFHTILVSSNPDTRAADRVIPSLHALPEAMPELWFPDGMGQTT